jgi:hypothetical protein
MNKKDVKKIIDKLIPLIEEDQPKLGGRSGK